MQVSYSCKMYKLLGFILVIAAWSTLGLANPQTPVVQTKLGPVQGLINTTAWHSIQYSSFRGIPYAEPPLGTRRFKPPVPKTPWTEVLNCSTQTTTCPQVDLYSLTHMGHEDCLYMNLYTPEVNFTKDMPLRPVMVWFFGGSYSWGYDNSTFYGPEYLLEDDVVLVVPNFRMGALGYLYLNISGAMGNAALKDQRLVLSWVRENIAFFGGNPDNVTIFGESSGSSSVLLHDLSDYNPAVQANYSRSIAQSGTPLFFALFHTPTQAYQASTYLASLLGIDTSSPEAMLEGFLQANADEMVNWALLMDIYPGTFGLPMRPTVETAALAESPDQVFLSECPITRLLTGDYRKHDVMLGFTNNELLNFLGILYGAANVTAVLQDILDPTNPFNLNSSYASIENLGTLSSDLTMVPSIDYHERLLAAASNDEFNIYYYQLSYESPYSMHEINGVASTDATTHFDDIGLLWDVKEMNQPTDPTDEFNVFRAQFIKLWTNFARYGNPTPDNDNPISPVVWEPAGTTGRQLNITESWQMIDRAVPVDSEITEILMNLVLPSTSGCFNVVPNNFIDLFSN